MITLREKGINYNVAIQTAVVTCSPSETEEQIVLLKPSGEILDRIRCTMDYRLGSGGMATEIHQEPEPDGARLIVRYVPRFPSLDASPDWKPDTHDILFHGRDYGFAADERALHRVATKPAQSDVWIRKGLCRARISDGKFAVLYPPLERPEEQMRAAQSLRVEYRSGNFDKWKLAVVGGREEVKNLVSAISVKGTIQPTGETGEVTDLASAISMQRAVRPIGEIGSFGSMPIRFLLPNGGTMTASFDTATQMWLEGWGQIELGSTDFYDKICTLLSKRGGKPVKLANEYGGHRWP